MTVALLPKRSGTASAVPTLGSMVDGELAINYTDKKYYMRVGGAVVDITSTSWNGGTVTGAATFSALLTANAGISCTTVTASGNVSSAGFFDCVANAAAGIRLNDRSTANNWAMYSSANVLSFSYVGTAPAIKCTNAGAFDIAGTAAGYFFTDRSTSDRWGWYSNAGTARFWHSTGGDLWTSDSSGNATIKGTLSIENGLAAGFKNLVSAVNTFAVGKLNKMSAGVTINTGNVADSTFYCYNNTAAAITLTQGAGLTLRLSGTATTGNRTLAARGFCMIYCISTTEYIVSGDVT